MIEREQIVGEPREPARMASDLIEGRALGAIELHRVGEQRHGDVDAHDRLAELDREVWGAERREEHELYLSGVFGGEEGSFALTDGGNLLGYGYAIEDFGGFIGPIAARDTGDQLRLLRMAASWLAEHEVSEAGAYCVSTNQTMMSAFLDAGWKIDHSTFLLASEPFGRLDRYLPSGGMLLYFANHFSARVRSPVASISSSSLASWARADGMRA